MLSKEYIDFLQNIKEQIRISQYNSIKFVNKQLVELYWNIGKLINEKQEIYGWGNSIVENLSIDLKKEFPGIKGFSKQNIWYMKKIYNTYHNIQKLQPLVGEISWSNKEKIIF